jgi:hypothetical protein
MYKLWTDIHPDKKTSSEQFVTYQYKHLFKIDRPCNWIVTSEIQHFDRNMVVLFKASSLTESLASLAIAIIDNVEPMIYEHLDKKLVSDIINSKDLEIIESTDCAKFGRQQAFKILHKELTTNVMHLNLYTMKDHKIYSITCNSNAQEYEYYLPTIEHMIESFHFV